jgi:hypothetical protein
VVVSGRKLGLLTAVGLLIGALFLASCGSTPSNPATTPTSTRSSVPTTGMSTTTLFDDGFPFTTSTTLLFPSQESFMRELSGDGYQTAILFTDQEGDSVVLKVWVGVDLNNASRATNDAIFDQAVALARKYGAADSTGGRLRVELFDSTQGGMIRDLIFESRDFDLSGGVELG